MCLGLGDEEFLRLSPRSFAALMDVYEEERERSEMRADLRAGLVASEVRNNGFRSGGQPVQPADYFPRLKRGPREQTPEEMRAVFRSIATAHNARRADAS